jgi:hypothetical protein
MLRKVARFNLLITACVGHLKNKINSHTPRCAPLRSRMRALIVSPTRCGTRLSSPSFGVRLLASRGGTVAGPARCAAACELRRSATGPARRGVRPLPSCPGARGTVSLPCHVATAEPLSTNTAGLLSPVNSTSQRASILPSRKVMFALKLHVASVCFKYFNCFRGMLQVFYTDFCKK